MSLLSIQNVSLSFGGLTAVSDFFADIYEGQIVGVIGPNGSGKTTLLNLVCGLQTPDAGTIHLFGKDVTGRRPDEIAALQLARTFQTSRLFPKMTVLENVMAGLHLVGSSKPWSVALKTRAARYEEEEMRTRAMQALSYVGFTHLADRLGSALSFGQQRIVEITRTLVCNPRIVLLDEPAVGLSITRIAELDNLLRRARDENGITFVMVEHVIRLVMGISDRIIVMNAGAKIADGTPKDVRSEPQVIEAYLGKGAYARSFQS